MKLFRKTVSFLLSLLLVTQLIPFSALPVVYAASAVDVSEVLTPEFVILNAGTGSSYRFYSNSVTKTGFDNYCNINAGFADPYGKDFYRNYDSLALKLQTYASGDSQKFYDHNYLWNYAGTTIQTLVDSGCLSIGAGATFNNNLHTHNKKYNYYCSMKMTLSEGSRQIREIVGYHPYTALDGEPADSTFSTSIDKGFGYYGKLNGGSNGTTVRLRMQQPQVTNSYNSKKTVDDCYNKTSIVSPRIYLYDGDKPTVKKVYLTGGADGSNFKAGDTLQVHVVFSEPMRFADGSANHGDAYVTLQLDGLNDDSYKAYLTKLGSATLDGKTVSEAIYTITIPSDCDEERKIVSVDLSQISKQGSSKYTLVHPYNISSTVKGSVNLADKKDSWMTIYNQYRSAGISEKSAAPYKEASNMISKSEGVTYATTLFTDIAGNSLTYSSQAQITGCYLDCKAPQVSGVSLGTVMNSADINAFVNAQVGSMSQLPDGVTDSGLTNADTFAGAGDSIIFTIAFSERLKWNSADDYKSIRVTTNVLDKNNNYVVLTAASSNAVSDKQTSDSKCGKGASGGYVTCIDLAPLVLKEGYTCDGDGIAVTAISFGAGKYPKDASGNVFSTWEKAAGEADKTIKLDVTPAAISNENPPAATAVSGQNSMDGFYVSLKIIDDGSGAEAVPGKLMLVNKDKPSDTFLYRLAVLADAAKSASSIGWETTEGGATKWYKAGEIVTFAQKPGDNYIYIGFDSTCSYDISQFELTVWPEDYAGNNGTNTGSSNHAYVFDLDYTLDQTGPVLTASAATRSYNSGEGEGTLTVPVTATDPNGFDTSEAIVKYFWSDSNKTAPGDNDWLNASTLQTDDTQADVSVSYTISDGESNSKYLWLKGRDLYGNWSAASCTGEQYAYNLFAVSYDASYPSDIAGTADTCFNVKNLSSGGGAAVLYRTPEMKVTDGGNTTEYWFISFTTRNDSSPDMLGSPERLVSVSEAEGVYTFTTAAQEVTDAHFSDWASYFTAGYYGEAEVMVLSGNKGAFTPSSESGDNVWAFGMTQAGGGYPVSAAEYRLRLCGNADPDDVISATLGISGPDDYENTYDNLTADDGYEALEAGETLLTDLTAYTFTLNLTPLLQTHWGLDAVDFGTNPNGTHKSTFNVYCCGNHLSYALEDLAVQNFRIPLEDTELLGSGFYLFTVELELKNGNSAEIALNGSGTDVPAIQVDTSPAAEDIGFSEYSTYLGADAEGNTYRLYVDQDAYEREIPISPSQNSSIHSEEGLIGTPLTLPLSADYDDEDASPSATKAGTFTTSLILANDGYAFERILYSGDTLVSGSQWIKITNTADGKSITKWILEDQYCGMGSLAGLTILPCSSGAEMKAAESTYIDHDGSDNVLLMVRGTTNVLTLQFFGFNGRVSDQKIMVVQPATQPVSGAVTLTDADDGSSAAGSYADRVKLTFTPEEGTDVSDLHVYGAFAAKQISDSVQFEGGKWMRYIGNHNSSSDEEFFYDQASGTFTHVLESEDGYHDGYAIIVVNEATGYVSPQILGDIFAAESDYCYSPDGPLLDRSEPVIVTEYNTESAPVHTSASPAAPAITDQGDGTYKIEFTVCDDVVEEGGEMTVILTPASDYADTLGMDTTAPAGFTYSFSAGQTSWEADTTSNEHGIFKAEATYYGSHGAYDDERLATVTLYGAVPAGDTVESIDVAFSIRVLDRFGKESEPVEVSARVNSQPVDVTSVSYVMTNIPYDSGDEHRYQTADMALRFVFNQPVVAQSSWICNAPSGYGQRVKQDEFPITRDGDYELEVLDIFGKLHQVPVTIDEIGGNGIDVTVSETELTGGPVVITASNGYDSLYHYFPYIQNGFEEATDPDNPNHYVISVTENGAYSFYVMDDMQAYVDCYYQGMYLNAEKITVYVDNIRTEAPDATPVFCFGETGNTYTPQTLPNRTEDGGTVAYSDLVVNGYVSVSYTAEEDIHPVAGTESSLTFFSDDTDLSYSFTYADAFGNTKTISGDLADYGILIAETDGPDTEKPAFSAQVYGVRGSNTIYEGGFTDVDTQAYIADQLSETGFVQSLLFAFSVRDASDVRLVLTDTLPQTLSYDAQSSSIAGVSVSGLRVTLGSGYAGGTFYVNVVDNAKEQTGADADNFISVPVSVDPSVLDNVSPTASVQYQIGLYSADIYLTISDTNDAGDNTTLTAGNTILPLTAGLEDISGPGEVRFKYTLKQNGITPLLFTDSVGNVGTAVVSASSIDVTAPELSVEWSPCAEGADGLLPEILADGPLNVPPVLKLRSSKPIDSYSLYVCLGNTMPLAADPGWSIWPTYASGVITDIEQGINTLTASFSGENSLDGVWVKAEITAPNGVSSVIITGFGKDTVDCQPPAIDLRVEELYRDGASEPYAYRFTATPDEVVYCLKDTAVTDGSGKTVRTAYTSEIPYVFTLSTAGSYRYIFTDLAGNPTTLTITVPQAGQTVSTYTRETTCYLYGSLRTEKDTDALLLDVYSAPVVLQCPDTEAPQLQFSPTIEELAAMPSAQSQQVDITASEACSITYCLPGGSSRVFRVNDPAADVLQVTFTKNGVMSVKAVDLTGNDASGAFAVGNVDDKPPVITIVRSTVSIRQDSTAADLKTLLDAGVSAVDEQNGISVPVTTVYSASGVDLSRVGVYTVTYTAEDEAGNTAQAVRYVKVYSKTQPGILVDGELAPPDETITIHEGTHTLTVTNLAKLESGEEEPYKLYVKGGLLRSGQMKYGLGSVRMKDDTVTLTRGYYTVYVITQSRESFRITLYVER